MRITVTKYPGLRLTRVRPFASPLAAAALALGLYASPATQTDGINPPLRAFLEKDMGLTAPDVQSVIAGRPVAKLLKTTTEDEVALFGVVRIHAPQELFIQRFRDITAFESGKGVLSIGRFHSPASLSDVAALQIDQKELKEIPECKPGDCTLKLSDRAMQSLQQQINWGSPQAAGQAQAVIRRAFADYVANYQKIGDAALAVNFDQEKPQAMVDDFRRLLQHSSHLVQYDPQLANYLENYPRARPSGIEDIFYWQKAEFGLKPVVRASHLIIHRSQHEGDVTYSIASKMLMASHYFRAGLELKSVVTDRASPGSFYLVCLNRSFVDGLTGVKGGLIRGTVKSRSRDSLARYLDSIKHKIEAIKKEG